MPCHCPLNSRKADWARTEDEVEKTASFRGTKARRATTRRGSPRNRGVCEWGRRGWEGEGGEGVEVPCRHLFQRPSTRTSRTRLEEKGGLGIPRPKPTQASPRSRSLQGWSHSSPWGPRRPSQPRGDHRHRHRSRLPPVRRVALVVATHARRLWSRQRRRQMTTTQLLRTWKITYKKRCARWKS